MKFAAIKLAEIEQLLTSRCPPEFVKNVITGLTKQFNMTGDHSSLDKALERHRKNVRGYACAIISLTHLLAD